jgi:hypothetical protein
MRIARLLLAASYQIVRVDPEEDWETAEQVDWIAKKVKIRPDSTKNVGFAAVIGGDQVVGGAYIGVTPDDDYGQSEPTFVYSFDVVVDPSFQWGRKIGLDLIKACEKERKFFEESHGNIYTRLYVVNPKLARFLEERYGYEMEEQYSHGSAHMTKW